MTTLPATRIACLVVLVTSVATAPLESGRSRATLGALVLLVHLLTRPRPRWLAFRLGPALLGLAALLVPLFLTSGAERALEVLVRALGATWIAACLASTVALSELGPALSTLGAPRSLASAVHMLLWQLEHVGSEGRRLVLARRLRGAERFGPEVLAQLLLRTTARAERVDLAMRLRGAGDAPPPGAWRLGVGDLVAPVLALALGVGLHWLGRSAP